MVGGRVHVCAEMLSKADQAHGAAVGSDTPIVTSVGVGTALTFTAAGAAGAAGDGAEPILDTKDPTKFVQFLGFAETIAFCKENGWCYNSVLPPHPTWLAERAGGHPWMPFPTSRRHFPASLMLTCAQ